MNRRRLMALARMVLKYPENYDQDTFGPSRLLDKRSRPRCGTAACLGGFAAARWNPGPAYSDDVISYGCGRRAAVALDLTDDQRQRLFEDAQCRWGGFGAAYNKAKTPKGRARVAYRRILHFIKTDGAE